MNAVAPGPVDTPMVEQMHSSAVRNQWLSTVPRKRYGLPREIATMAAFLLDDSQPSYVTGQTINVDGGFTAAGLM